MNPFMLGLAALLLAGQAAADLTLNGRSTVVSMNMPATSQERIYLKKSILRRDKVERGKAHTYLFDLNGQEIRALDHSLRQLQVVAMSPPATTPEAKIADKDIKLDLDPTGQKHPLGTWNCLENNLVASMPAELGPERINLQLNGKVWLAKGTRELKDLQAFFKAMEAPDFLVGIPALQKTSAAQNRAVGDILQRLFKQGMVCAIDVEVRYEGGGRMAELARRMGTRFTLAYDSVTTEALPDDYFAVPTGYQTVK